MLLKRATGRRICTSCKSVYNVYFDGYKPKEENVCDKCGGVLIQREDDMESTFKKRYTIYLDETEPLIKYYEELGKLKKINANVKEEEIFENIKRCLNDKY